MSLTKQAIEAGRVAAARPPGRNRVKPPCRKGARGGHSKGEGGGETQMNNKKAGAARRGRHRQQPLILSEARAASNAMAAKPGNTADTGARGFDSFPAEETLRLPRNAT